MTIASLLKKTTHIDPSEKDILLAHALRKPKEYLLAHDDEYVSLLTRLAYYRAVRRRQKGDPIAYITGHKAFYGLDFFVSKQTLVPRPETEHIVEDVIVFAKNIAGEKVLIDVGTGSGCIPIAIGYCSAISSPIFATDISKKALRVAKQNAQKHTIAIHFSQGNLLAPLLKEPTIFAHKHVFITANLPYLNEEEFASEPSIQKEPKTALVAADDGLALYKELCEQIREMQNTQSIHVWCEINHWQEEKMRQIIHDYVPQAIIRSIPDLCGKTRIIQFSRLPDHQ